MKNGVLNLWHSLKLNATKIRKLRVLKEARTVIMFWYVFLMVFFVAIAVPTIKQRLFARVDARVRDYLSDEVEDFQEVLLEELLESTTAPNLRLKPNYPPTSKISDIFAEYLEKRVTEDDNFLITIVDGEFYESSPRGLPKPIQPDSQLMGYWQNLSEESEGEIKVSDPNIGSILYQALPIKTSEVTLGVFVVAHATAGERKEAIEALDVIIEVKILILIFALFLAWFAAGRILAPLNLLNKTAKLINESDLSQRIPVRGEGEIAELGKTFNDMMDRLESAFATQRNFINDASHELRTPITIIRGHLELMGDDPQEKADTVHLVLDELDRMNRLVDDLVLLAKAERPDFLQLETVDVGLLTEELFTKARTLADRQWSLDNIAKGKIVVDRQRLTQAMMNLAQNATQHTVAENLIAIGSTLNKDRVEFWVRDTGEGIAKNDQKRIFERFARATNARRRSEGAGLGLSIVKAIAEAHGGYIRLESNLGIGSTFIIVLPIESGRNLVLDRAV
ncbi:integral membrane sensor signal transduction histidine kinase [Stanieria cyanosphaera PCC 7437]|uniref:histidine kinase n=1 Tax=Stanieria cyanosphaera (strain ATCC 29371 / PCC 7437) TaxID=111780 RepID=K9XTY9_STAC7|nr:HAMP domain-containing sensor histidine kinase [Stanieria cyanosphaera]AFZ35127.1 integral membrane sensor signal transduction histidine kinase [Stanieria cyanosphaera PCC 7437]